MKTVRRITCFVGKLKFRSGYKIHQNYLQTPTAVAGVRGSEAFLGSDGIENYITPIAGEFSYIGEFIEGYFDNPGVDAAAKSNVYKAIASAYEAYQTAEKSGSSIDQAKAELSGLEAIKAAAEELSNNPDPNVAAEARQVLVDVETKINELKQEIENMTGSSSGGGLKDPMAFIDPSGLDTGNNEPPVSTPSITVTVPTTIAYASTTEATPTTEAPDTTTMGTDPETIPDTANDDSSNTTNTTSPSNQETTTTTEPPANTNTSGDTLLTSDVTGDDFSGDTTLNANFEYDDHWADATLTGNLTGQDTLIVGDIDGTTTGVSPGFVKGVFRGVEGSLKGHVATVLVGTNGDVGYITGEQSGEVIDGAFSTTGDLTREIVQSGTNKAISDLTESNYPIPVLGMIPSGSIKQGSIDNLFTTSESTVRILDIGSGKKIGVWGASTSGGNYYENTIWSGKMYGQTGSAGDIYPGYINDDEIPILVDYYMMGDLSGNNNSSVISITGENIEYLDPFYKGKIDLRYYGIEDEGATTYPEYKSAGAGTWTATRLDFSGDWGNEGSDNLYFDDSGNLDTDGSMHGLIGFTSNGSGYDFFAMGSYTEPSGNLDRGLFNAVIHQGFDDSYFPTALDGYVGGIWRVAAADTFTGSVYVLRSSNNSAGILYGGIAGTYDTDIDMWKAAGSGITYQEIKSSWDPDMVSLITGTINGTLRDGSFFDSSGGLTGSIAGSNPSNDDPSQTAYLRNENGGEINQDWGVFRLFFGHSNRYTDKPSGITDWTATVSGTGDFVDSYGDQLSNVSWEVDVDGTWTDNGEVNGTISSANGIYRDECDEPAGYIRGDFYGVGNGDGEWIGQLVGRWGTGNAGFSEGTSLYRFTNGTLLRIGTDPADVVIAEEATDQFYFLARGDYAIDGADQVDYLQHTLVRTADKQNESPKMRGYLGTLWKEGVVDGAVNAVYVKTDGQAGILTGHIDGFFNNSQNRWNAPGFLGFVTLETGIDADSAGFVEQDISLTGSGGFSTGANLVATAGTGSSVSIEGETWGIWESLLGGDYSGTPGDSWHMDLKDEANDTHQWVSLAGELTNPGKLDAKAAGAWVNWGQAVTGIMGGKLKGTFDPADPTWQAVAAGGWLDTHRFLELSATAEGRKKLQQLNIPCIEIGRANLSGRNALMSVNMNDVTFFAYSNGASPKIWATDGVNGTYRSAPNPGHSVSLSGNGLNAAFKVNNWNNQTWGATVKGAGALNRNTGGTVNVQFNGAAAGTHQNGRFSGTGAGVTK